SATATCSSGAMQCCNTIQPASSQEASNVLGMVGVNLQGLDVPVGIDCTPMSMTGNNCQSQLSCCENS
ncbi:hypothetical protein CONPUDRAFT_43646, partial [Coniophora puteana RWD-64-598 SS2]